jgi:hypothetical protein
LLAIVTMGRHTHAHAGSRDGDLEKLILLLGCDRVASS